MARLLKNLILGWLVAGAALKAGAFSLLGPSPAAGASNPAAAWQDPAFNIGYNPLNTDIGGPMNLGEEYRWNVPVITYAFDESFLNYFGASGVSAVEGAIGILNNLTNLSAIKLDDYPLDVTRVNFHAQALRLADLKSSALSMLLEQLGLAEPERYVWTLRDRRIITPAGGGTPTTNYFVIQRNFDPASLTVSPYVNGTLYTYQIREFRAPPADYAQAVTFPADPLATVFTSVAGGWSGFGLGYGTYYTGLTRDDVGGLRYLYATNNVNVERLLTDHQVAVTNRTTMVGVATQDLELLTERSYGTTLTAAQITALYPGIQIAQVFQRVTNMFVTNYAGNTVILTPVLTNVFDYTYSNVQTNVYSTTSQIRTQVVEVVPTGFVGPGGALLQTNLLSSGLLSTNLLSGEFTIIPTNQLGYEIAYEIYSTVTEVTNIVITNATARFTNDSTLVNVQTIDLATFTGLTMSNSPAQLAAAFTAAFPGQPALLITSSNSYFTNVVSTTITNQLVSSPYDPIGAQPRYQLITNYTTNVAQRYVYTFGNVVTNGAFLTNGVFNPNPGPYSTSGTIAFVQTDITKNPYLPAVSTNLTTNVTTTLVVSNFPNGSIYVVPTNLFGYNLLSLQLMTVTNAINNVYAYAFTNSGNRVTNTLDMLRFVTNYYLTANPIQFLNPTNTGLLGPGTRQEVVRFATNTFKGAFAITLQSTSTTQPALRRGVDKITFRRMQPDSAAGATYLPLTNDYSDVIVTNGASNPQFLRRVVTQPDILFTAEDLGLLTLLGGPVPARRTTANAWVNGDTINGDATLPGPGVIPPQVVIAFNKVGPTQVNTTPYLLDEFLNNGQYFIWGSFDGSTNQPVVYPIGTSIHDLESLLLAPVINTQPQSQTVSAGGIVTFTAVVSGQPPLTYGWQLNGTAVAGANAATLTLTGVTPASAGNYTLTVTNAYGTATSQPATLTVVP